MMLRGLLTNSHLFLETMNLTMHSAVNQPMQIASIILPKETKTVFMLCAKASGDVWFVHRYYQSDTWTFTDNKQKAVPSLSCTWHWISAINLRVYWEFKLIIAEKLTHWSFSLNYGLLLVIVLGKYAWKTGALQETVGHQCQCVTLSRTAGFGVLVFCSLSFGGFKNLFFFLVF